jgi:hypothetical protein
MDIAPATHQGHAVRVGLADRGLPSGASTGIAVVRRPPWQEFASRPGSGIPAASQPSVGGLTAARTSSTRLDTPRGKTRTSLAKAVSAEPSASGLGPRMTASARVTATASSVVNMSGGSRAAAGGRRTCLGRDAELLKRGDVPTDGPLAHTELLRQLGCREPGVLLHPLEEGSTRPAGLPIGPPIRSETVRLVF